MPDPAVGRARGRRRSGEKGGFKDRFAAEVDAEIEALVGPGATDGLDFEAIEQAARRQALRVAARAVERRLNADRTDYLGPTVSCACGQAARYAGRRPKTLTTALGSLTLERACYHCDACHAGICPRDRALGVHGTSLSPATTRMVGHAAASVSFAETGELLRELAGARVETKQVERTAEALGREVADDERDVVEPEPGAAPTMYLGLDGTGVPVRKSEIDGRRGKQPDGAAKTREVKLVTVWTAERRDKDGIPVRDPGSVSCSAAVESAASRDTDPLPSPFARRAGREARRRRFYDASRRVVLGDGNGLRLSASGRRRRLRPGSDEPRAGTRRRAARREVAGVRLGAPTGSARKWAAD